MKSIKKELVQYRLKRSFETCDDAKLLVEKSKCNSAINRLCYPSFYAVSALIILRNLSPSTNRGVRIYYS